MVVTILQAEVDPARAPDLVAAYREGIGELEPGIVETYLLHDARDDTQWRIVTGWASLEALQAMRAAGQTPRASPGTPGAISSRRRAAGRTRTRVRRTGPTAGRTGPPARRDRSHPVMSTAAPA